MTIVDIFVYAACVVMLLAAFGTALYIHYFGDI